MITLKHVLVPTDFSDASDVAVIYGQVLAKAFGAQLHLLHVVPEATALPWAAVTDVGSLDALQKEWETEAGTRLQQLVPDDADRERVTVVTRTGDPARQIVAYAADNEVDLLVIGTHGRGFVAHVFLGSVAEQVVRRAPCPVLTVRHPQHEFVTEALSGHAAHAHPPDAPETAVPV